MTKQKVLLHVGLPHSGGHVLMSALERHADVLSQTGIQQPAKSEDEMFRAAVEIRRDHRAWGLRRKDVDGVWSHICRRAYRTSDTLVLGHDLLAGCSTDEIALLVDRLREHARELAERNEYLQRKRRKLKRRLTAVG